MPRSPLDQEPSASQQPLSRDLSDRFGTILKTHLSTLSRRHQEHFQEFKDTSYQDVIGQLIRVQNDLAARRSLVNMRRMQRYVKAMGVLGRICKNALNTDETLPYFWGPCILLVKMMSGNNRSLDQLMEEYAVLGETLSEIAGLKSEYSGQDNRHVALAFIYDQILDFHIHMFRFVSGKDQTNVPGQSRKAPQPERSEDLWVDMIRYLHERNQMIVAELERLTRVGNFSYIQEVEYMLRRHQNMRPRSFNAGGPWPWSDSDPGNECDEQQVEAGGSELQKGMHPAQTHPAVKIEDAEGAHRPNQTEEAGDSEFLRDSCSGRLTDLSNAFSLLNRWMTRCKTEHPICHASRNAETALPTRVVEVGSDNNSIRLIEAGGRSGCYAALSYCWGRTDSNYTTSMQNYSQNLDAISWHVLPRTVQDAILITRGLHVPYLWVDALCIIQSTSDWEAEAGRMASVYLNSYITIGAAAASDCAEGFLERCWLPDGNMDATELSNVSATDHERRAQETQQSPLFQRAWALQELVLSPRTILFTEGGLVWLCKKLGIHKNSVSEVNDQSILIDLTGEVAGYGTNSLLSPYTWWSWVTDYSRRQLTFKSDRLAAIVGITDYYARHMSHTPILGLWEENLLHDLLWRASGPGRRDVSAELTLPTWSWLSHQSPITIPTDFFTRRFNPTAEIVDCESNWDGKHLVSRLVSTKLVLRTVLLQASVQFIQHESLDENVYSFHMDIACPLSLHLRPSLGTALKGPGLQLDQVNVLEDGYCLLDYEDDYEQPSSEATFPCIEIGTHEEGNLDRELLLLRCIDRQLHIYERIGVGTVSDQESNRKISGMAITLQII
ncbi:heterokaryon incompatibility protein-domain-containing protein [Pyrenochaeta sp. MPI-SDFR-AT-0127]|nr:heterokaryon incompatibility protein-domain-containing protein [Pyrenochaeta sp. MPI-SDFR-AT-0127]